MGILKAIYGYVFKNQQFLKTENGCLPVGENHDIRNLGVFSDAFQESEKVVESLFCSLVYPKPMYSIHIFLNE